MIATLPNKRPRADKQHASIPKKPALNVGRLLSHMKVARKPNREETVRCRLYRLSRHDFSHRVFRKPSPAMVSDFLVNNFLSFLSCIGRRGECCTKRVSRVRGKYAASAMKTRLSIVRVRSEKRLLFVFLKKHSKKAWP